MVPDSAANKINDLSSLNTLLNIINQFLELTIKNQDCILNQEWDKIYVLSSDQEKLNHFFDNALKKINGIANGKKYGIPENPEMYNLKNQIKQKIREYKEKEIINIKLLNDAMFLAKKKVEHFFNKTVKNNTYKKDKKKQSNLWDDNPVIYNSVI